jgi:ubiquinone/menaquinone biosynthesis C-methylase UbiE
MIDELGSAGRENLDREHAARYDTKEDADAEAEVALLRNLGLRPDSTVIEFGAGTGQFTLAVHRSCKRVIAVDVSPVMLEQLRTKVTRAGATNVEVIEAGFLTYQHAGPTVDVVYSRYALHHLPDFWKAIALDRMRRCLSAGAVLRLWDVVFSFDPGDAELWIERWCAGGGTSLEQEWSRDELEEHVRDEHSTYTWLLEPMIERAGFRIEARDTSDDRIFAKYVARAI